MPHSQSRLGRLRMSLVDRRAAPDEEDRTSKEQRYAEVKTGDVLNGKCAHEDFGAFRSTWAASTVCSTSGIFVGPA